MGPIIMVSPQVEQWRDFGAELGQRCNTDVIAVRSGLKALETAREAIPVAVLVDQDVGDMPGASLIPQVLKINAMIHVALVSEQSAEHFHEATEGLGILMKLPPCPDRQTATLFSESLLGVI